MGDRIERHAVDGHSEPFAAWLEEERAREGDGSAPWRSLLRIALPVGAALWMLLVAGDAADAAQTACLPEQRMISELADSHGETPVSAGLTSNGSLTTVYLSEETGTWTIVVTSPDGISCVVLAGKHWWTVDQALAGQPS